MNIEYQGKGIIANCAGLSPTFNIFNRMMLTAKMSGRDDHQVVTCGFGKLVNYGP